MSFLDNLIDKHQRESKEPFDKAELINQANLVKNQFEAEDLILEKAGFDLARKIKAASEDRLITCDKLLKIEDEQEANTKKRSRIQKKIADFFPDGWDA